MIKDEEDALAELRKIKQQANAAKKRFKELQKDIDSEFLKKEKDLLSPQEKTQYVQQEELRGEVDRVGPEAGSVERIKLLDLVRSLVIRGIAHFFGGNHF